MSRSRALASTLALLLGWVTVQTPCLAEVSTGWVSVDQAEQVKSEFKAASHEVVALLQSLGSGGGLASVDIEKVSRVASQAVVDVRPQVYLADGREVDAKNYGTSLPLTVEIHYSRWLRSRHDRVLRLALVFHELLGLLGQDYESYPYSARFLAVLKRIDQDSGSGQGGIRFASLGMNHGCFTTFSGQARCWGWNTSGQLGDGNLFGELEGGPEAPGPKKVRAIDAPVIAIRSGEKHSCALIEGGHVMCWGLDFGGGSSSFAETRLVGAPIYVYNDPFKKGQFPSDPARLLAVHSTQSCLLTENGSFYCWGTDFQQDSRPTRIQPQLLFSFPKDVASQIVSITLGFSHGCLLWNSGAVSCFGKGFGPLPRQIHGMGVARSIVSGSNFSCALLLNGQVKCWGSDLPGIKARSPETVLLKESGWLSSDQPLSNVTKLSAGARHVCALLGSGQVLCWGDNGRKQLGTEAQNYSAIPLVVAGLTSGVSDLACGYDTSCALLKSGRMACWGFDFSHPEARVNGSRALMNAQPAWVPGI